MGTPRVAKTPAKLEKLVGTGTQGNFVHQTQKMGVEAGFKNVSQKWLDTGCLTYDQVSAKIQEGHVEIEDFRIPFGAMRPIIGDDGAFAMQYDGMNFKPTPFSFSQIAKMAGVSRFDVEMLAGLRPDSNGKERNRPEDRQALLNILNTGFSLIDLKKNFLFRTQKDGTLRAWLSTQYYIMDNQWFLDILKDIIPGGLFSHWKTDGDFSTLWGNILIPDTIRQEADSDYGAMYSVGNSEIGRRKLSATPSLFRAICMNGCIWDQKRGKAFVRIHKGEMDLLVLRNELRAHLTKQIPLINNSIDDLLATRTIGWDGASAKPVFAALGDKFRLSKGTNTDILGAWRQQANDEDGFRDDENLRRSAFAVINAVTRSAEQSSNPESWVRRDELGGSLMEWNQDNWKSLFSQAKNMKADKVKEYFSVSAL